MKWAGRNLGMARLESVHVKSYRLTDWRLSLRLELPVDAVAVQSSQGSTVAQTDHFRAPAGAPEHQVHGT